jgi:hypothetical protein
LGRLHAKDGKIEQEKGDCSGYINSKCGPAFHIINILPGFFSGYAFGVGQALLFFFQPCLIIPALILPFVWEGVEYG